MGRIEFKPDSKTYQLSQAGGLMVLQAQLPGISTATKANGSLVFRSGSHSCDHTGLPRLAPILAPEGIFWWLPASKTLPLSADSGFTPLRHSSFSMSAMRAPTVPELSHFLTQKPRHRTLVQLLRMQPPSRAALSSHTGLMLSSSLVLSPLCSRSLSRPD